MKLTPALLLISDLLHVSDGRNPVGDQGWCPTEYKAVVGFLEIWTWTKGNFFISEMSFLF